MSATANVTSDKQNVHLFLYFSVVIYHRFFCTTDLCTQNLHNSFAAAFGRRDGAPVRATVVK